MLNHILEKNIIIPLLICLVLCAVCYLIGLLPISKKEKRMIQEITALARERDKRAKDFEERYQKKKHEYEHKHEVYTSFLVFLEKTTFNIDIGPTKAKQDIATFKHKLNQVKLIASDNVKSKFPEYLVLDDKFRIDTKPLKIAMREELNNI